jgi:hypothetical protein
MPPSMPPRRPSQDKLVGTLVGRRYLIKSFIAGGGMGSVYEAWDTRFEGEVVVAVKTLRVDLGDSELWLQLFEEEAQLSAILGNHPRIIRVMDHGLDSDQPFLVMEYLGRPPQGQSLRAVLDEGLPLAPERSLRIAIQSCDGLHFAHTSKTMLANRSITGVIHRDIKPSNIFLIQEGTLGETVKILDFGIAKAISEATSALGTNMGFKGTFQYASPEQLRGENLDARSDIYSLGLVIYQMLSGRMPLQSPTNSLGGWYQTHNYDKPLPLPQNLNDRQLPDGLVEVVMSCLEKDANRRPASMKVLQDQLQTFLDALLEKKAAPDTKLEMQRLMQAKLEAVGLEQERLEGERKLREQQEAIRREQERLEVISRERVRLEALLKVKEQLVAIQQEQERLEAEQREAERRKNQLREAEQREAERREAERREAERREAQRREAEQRKLEQLAQAEKAREQLELIQRETERLAAARQEQELREQQRLRQEQEEAEQRERKRLELEQREQSLLELQKQAQGQLASLQQLEALRRGQEQEAAQRRQQEQLDFERHTREQLERIRQEQDQLEALRQQWIAGRSDGQSRAVTQLYSEEEWQAEIQAQQQMRDRLEALLKEQENREKAQAESQVAERMEQQRKQQEQQVALASEQQKLGALQREQKRLEADRKVREQAESQRWEVRRREAEQRFQQQLLALESEQEKLDALRQERQLMESEIVRQKRLKPIWIASLASALLLAGVAIVIAMRTADPTTQLLEQANQSAQRPGVESLGEALEVLDSVALDNQSAAESRRLWSEKLLKAANFQAQSDPAKAIFLAEKVSTTAPQFQEAQTKIRLWATPLLLLQEMHFLEKIHPVRVYSEPNRPAEITIEMPPQAQGNDLGNERGIKEFTAALAAAYTEKKRNSWRQLTVKSKAGLQASLSFNDWQTWRKEADQVSSTAQNSIYFTKKLYEIIKVTPVPVAMTTAKIQDTLHSRYLLTVYRPQTEQLKIFLSEKLPHNEAAAKSRVRELATNIWQLDHTSRKMVITLLDGQASLVTQGFNSQEVQTALGGMDLKRN